ncbi:hypothetical protein JCM19037_4110 [Geomicrobium sp. JCM 19037]|uniref:hypothetical protein n=1 Tax=Geomicrobium sp. JCM 19037 TaxID=1460634 RepID=UPI00045F24A3|nr:hypothetical protein [Geomicrobium sp. JCM 19037]GAK05599.1 hypothetical protein JCM19037_4110 [Geomicrobium sp. JCM 19037]
MRRSEWLPVMLATAIIACVAVALDLLLSPSLTWSPFLLLLLLLWPLSHLPYRTYSITGSALIFITLALINSIETPHYAWVLYALPIFVWPISAWFPRTFKTSLMAWVCFFIISLYYIGLNIGWEDRFPWAIFPVFALLWWPMTVQFVRRPVLYAFVMSGLLALFFIVVNLVTSPQELWAVYPIFVFIWWPLSMYYFYGRQILSK